MLQDIFTAIQADRIDTKIQVYEDIVIDLEIIVHNNIHHNDTVADHIILYLNKLRNKITELKNVK